LKCLEKEWSRRYGTAEALAEDLGRFLRGEATVARPVHAWGRIQRWCQRKPVVAGLMGGVILLLLLVLVGSPIAVLQINRARMEAVEIAAREAEQRERAELTLRRLDIENIRGFFQSDRAAGGVAWLAYLLRERPDDEAAAEWLINELTQRSFALPVLRPMSHADMVHFATFSPDGTARIWDGFTGQPVSQPLEHPDLVWWACLSPDNHWLATGGRDGLVRLWDAASGKDTGPNLKHKASLNYFEFSPDGRWLVTSSENQTAQVWEVATGRPRGKPMHHQNSVRWACFSPDGQRILTASADSTARIWDAATGEAITPSLVHDALLSCASFSPDGRWVATGSFDMTVRIWDGFTGEPVGNPLVHKGCVRWVEFSPDGQRLATASEDGTARIWDVLTGRPLTEPITHEGVVWSARFSPDGTRLLTASGDRTARVWDVRTGDALPLVLRENSQVRHAEWSPDGKRVVTVCSGSVLLWDGSNGLPASVRYSYGDHCWQARFTPDGQAIITLLANGVANLIGSNSGKLLIQLHHPPTRILDADFSSDGAWIVTAASDGLVRVWNRHSGELRYPPLPHEDTVWTARFSPDGKRLVTASADHQARIWSAEKGEPLGVPLQHNGELVMATFSPSGEYVLTASNDGTARIWETNTGKPTGPALEHRGPVNCARFNPAGHLIVTASDDKTARIWDAQTCQPLGGSLLHQGKVVDAHFSPDGDRIVTASADGTARIWHVATRQPLAGPLRHEKPLRSADFSPDGRWVLTASEDRTARISRIMSTAGPPPNWLPTLAEATVGRRITEARTEQAVPSERFLQFREEMKGNDSPDCYRDWAHWFLADRAGRGMAPQAPLSLDEYAEQLIHAANRARYECLADMALVLRFQPTNGAAFGQVARLIDALSSDLGPRDQATMEWASRRAVELSPDDPIAWWGRATYLRRRGDDDAAREAMDRGFQIGFNDPCFDLDHTRCLLNVHESDQAVQAFKRAQFNVWNVHNPSYASSWVECWSREQVIRLFVRTLAAENPSPTTWKILRLGLGIPDRGAETPTEQIDLSDFYNAGLGQFWRDLDLDNEGLYKLPSEGLPQCAVTFDIRGVILNHSPGMASTLANVPVHRLCQSLWFLYGARHEASPGTEVARFVVHTKDQVNHDLPVVYGKDVLVLATKTKEESLSARPAWEYLGKDGYYQRLFVTHWKNSNPNAVVESVDVISLGTKAGPFLIAITAIRG
jgi:WD40 repeat protein